MRRYAAGLGLVTAAAVLAGCIERGGLRPDPGHDDFADDLPLASLVRALGRSRTAVSGEPAEAEDRLLRILRETAPGAERHRAVRGAFRVRPLPGKPLVTAYYEPEIRAALVAGGPFRWPIHGLPPDDVDRGRTRAEIYAGALDGRGLEIAWTDDPVALFVLHAQGSGRMRFADGRVVPLRYAGTNGRPYRALGAVLAERGMLPIEEATLPAIRRALAALPEEGRLPLLAENPRYTFLAVGTGEDPQGSFGVPLTPGRSLAADPRVVSPGSVMWLATPSVRRFAVVQDSGAAIVGSRLDLFVGAGETAEAFAGTFRERGRAYVLEPR